MSHFVCGDASEPAHWTWLKWTSRHSSGQRRSFAEKWPSRHGFRSELQLLLHLPFAWWFDRRGLRERLVTEQSCWSSWRFASSLAAVTASCDCHSSIATPDTAGYAIRRSSTVSPKWQTKRHHRHLFAEWPIFQNGYRSALDEELPRTWCRASFDSISLAFSSTRWARPGPPAHPGRSEYSQKSTAWSHHS